MDYERLKKLSLNLCSDKDNYMKSFKKNLDMYVSQKDITLREISEIADVPFETLRNFLYKESTDCKLSTVIKLARALNVSIDELVGAETIPPLTTESVQMCRNLPENDLYLVRWFIRYLDHLNSKTEPNKRYVSVMMPEQTNNGDFKVTSNYEKVEITDLEEPLRSKIFMGFHIICDHYMPHYIPGDIILIANDRLPKFTENAVVRVGKFLFIVKRVVENGVAKYYSIRDGKYRIDESEVDELIGYIAAKEVITK